MTEVDYCSDETDIKIPKMKTNDGYIPGISYEASIIIKMCMILGINYKYYIDNGCYIPGDNGCLIHNIGIDSPHYNNIPKYIFNIYILISIIIIGVIAGKGGSGKDIHFFYLLYVIFVIYYIFFQIVIKNNINQDNKGVIIFQKMFSDSKLFPVLLLIIWAIICIRDSTLSKDDEGKILNSVGSLTDTEPNKTLIFFDYCLNIVLIVYFIFIFVSL